MQRSELMARMTYLLDGEQRRGRMSRLVSTATSVVMLGGIGMLGTILPEPGIEMEAAERVVVEQLEPPQDPKPQDPKPKDPKKNPDRDPVALAVRLISILDLESHRDLTIRELARLGEPAIPPLQRALQDEREVVVTGALQALAGMHRHRGKTAPLLIPFVADKRANVATTAIRALTDGWTRGQRIRETLFSALRDKRAVVVVAATRALTRIRSRRGEFAGTIIALLQDQREQVVIGAMRSLSPVVRPLGEIVPLLIPFVTDKRDDVAVCAIHILGVVGTRRVAPTLIQGLRDKRPVVVCATISALSQVSGQRHEFTKALVGMHISWLRQVLEKDPREPKIIKTMRGVGYMLDV